MNKQEYSDLLRKHGMRATKNRIEVLMFMENQKHPIGISVLQAEFPSINEATLYRMASDFVEKSVWKTFDLGHSHTDYESANRPHHHHAVCEGCGIVEEVYGCQKECQLIKTFGRNVKKFQTLNVPSTAIFGTCTNCANA